MTYEEKMLAVFARFRGQALNEQTLKQIEKACQEEVWSHLPDKLQATWKLHLAMGRDSGIELRPEQLQPGGAAELENALTSPFQERHKEEASGGMMGISLNFSGNVKDEQPGAAVTSFQVGGAPHPDALSAKTSVNPLPQKPEPMTKSLESNRATTQDESSTLSAQSIEAQAKALGISLPTNSSLLQPFLEALAAASEYKLRAEKAEAQLRKLLS